ncbi:MAG: hypothetical protein AB7P40_16645 [Chloroflexota bacterium]
MPDTLSHQGWYDRLIAKSKLSELTVQESMLLCLHNIQNHLHDLNLSAMTTAQAVEHVEGMVGAIDAAAGHMARQAGVPYPESGKVRAALDAQRDAERTKALGAREENHEAA